MVETKYLVSKNVNHLLTYSLEMRLYLQDMKRQKPQNKGNILGIKVDSTSAGAVLRQIQFKLTKKVKFYIVTPNPEQVLIAQNDTRYFAILNSADISIPDGVGLIAAAKFLSLPLPQNRIHRALTLFAQGLGVGFSILFDKHWLESELKLIKGREIFTDLVKLANKKHWTIVLVGDKFLSAQKAADKLKQNFINLNIYGITGPDLKNDGTPRDNLAKKTEDLAIKRINEVNPDLLFIGFRSPVQEKWLSRLYTTLNFTCAMVVGGTFDYMSGKKKIPPAWMADMGLEWFWRLAIGDQKVKRVIHAFPDFPIKVFWQKFTQ